MSRRLTDAERVKSAAKKKARVKEYNRMWRESNPDYAKKASLEWRKNNKARQKEYELEYYRANKERKREYNSSWQEAHPGYGKAHAKAWHQKNTERANESCRRWRKANPEMAKEACRRWLKAHPEADRSYKSRRRALKIGGGGSHTAAEWRDLVSAHGGRCLRCGVNEKMSMDHVVPLSRGGHDGIENLQPLCMPCNARKGVASTDYRPLKQAALSL